MNGPKTSGDQSPAESRGKISRRRLLAGGVVAAPTLALLHETVPHQGLHDALSGNGAEAEAAAMSGHPVHSTDAGHATGGHAAFAAGREVDHAANGFDPTEILRDFDWGTHDAGSRAAGCCASGSSSPPTRRSRSRPGSGTRPGPTTAACPGPTLRCREGERLRIRFVNGSDAPAHDPLPRHPPGGHGRDAGHRRGRGGGAIGPGERFTYEFDAEPFGLHLYHCHVSPLAEHIAKGLYGAFIIDPRQRARRTPTSW